MTLTECLKNRIDSSKFKRPIHANSYAIWQYMLVEMQSDMRWEWPRLSVEDLTSTDWEFVG